MSEKEEETLKGAPTRLRNFDPRRSHKYTHKYISVKIVNTRGREYIAEIPLYLLEGKSKKEKDKFISQVGQVFELADGTIDRDKLRNPVLLDGIAEAIASVTGVIIGCNLGALYFERAQDEETYEEISVETEVESEPKTEEESDRAFIRAIIQHVAKLIKPEILGSITESAESNEQAAHDVWINIFAEVLFDIIGEISIEAFYDLPGEQRESMFNEYLDRKFSDYYKGAISIYAQHIARVSLNLLNPAEMPIHELRLWVGVKGNIEENVEKGLATLLHIEEGQFGKIAKIIEREAKSISYHLEGDDLYFKVTLTNYNHLMDKIEALMKGTLKNRRYSKNGFRRLSIEGAKKLARQAKDLTQQGLADVLIMARQTVIDYLADDPQLWPILEEEHLKTRLEILKMD